MEEKNPFKKWQEAKEYYERLRRRYRSAKDSGEFYRGELEGFREEMELAKVALEQASKECEKALGN